MDLIKRLTKKLIIQESPNISESIKQQYKPSAVLVGITDEHHPKIILTKRTAHLPTHAGQISFPGGKLDKNDSNLIATALREAEEEIGLTSQQINVLGCFEPFFTLSGFYIAPIIALIKPQDRYAVNTSEVDEIIEAPLNYFLDVNLYQEDYIIRNKQKIPIFKFYYQEHFIWGATAKILRNIAKQMA